MLNKVQIIGRLGKDVELRYTQAGIPVATMSIATDESYTGREGNKVDKTEWHRVTAFQKVAENCSSYLAKGSLVYVEGSLQTRKWEDQQGQDRYTTEIKAQRVQFLDHKSDGSNAPAKSQQSQPPQRSKQQRPQNNSSQLTTYDDDLGPAFPTKAQGADEIPF